VTFSSYKRRKPLEKKLLLELTYKLLETLTPKTCKGSFTCCQILKIIQINILVSIKLFQTLIPKTCKDSLHVTCWSRSKSVMQKTIFTCDPFIPNHLGVINFGALIKLCGKYVHYCTPGWIHPNLYTVASSKLILTQWLYPRVNSPQCIYSSQPQADINTVTVSQG